MKIKNKKAKRMDYRKKISKFNQKFIDLLLKSIIENPELTLKQRNPHLGAKTNIKICEFQSSKQMKKNKETKNFFCLINNTIQC
jgi:ribosome assembly protein YihI (activator of Der GTPase)